MTNKKGNGWVWFLTIPLLAYSAFRNLDLVISTLGNDTGSIILAVGALFALDIGVLLWLRAFINARRSDGLDQGDIALVMIIVDLIGAVAGMLADTLLKTNADYKGFVSLVAWWGVPIIIGLNFAAGILYHTVDPDRQSASRERELQDTLQSKLTAALKDNSGTIVQAALPAALAHRQREAVAQFLSSVAKSGDKSIDVQSILDRLGLGDTDGAGGSDVEIIGAPAPQLPVKKNGSGPKDTSR